MTPSKDMTEDELKKIRERADKALQEVFALCKGKHWRMCIPVQTDDSDRLLATSLDDIPRLLDEVERLKVLIKMMEEGTNDHLEPKRRRRVIHVPENFFP